RLQAGTTGWTFPGSSGCSGVSRASSSKTRTSRDWRARAWHSRGLLRLIRFVGEGSRRYGANPAAWQRRVDQGDLHLSLMRWKTTWRSPMRIEGVEPSNSYELSCTSITVTAIEISLGDSRR